MSEVSSGRLIFDATWITSPRASIATVMTTMWMPSNIAGTSKVKREAPDGPSMPMTARVKPISSAVRPLSAESDTTAEVATKAKTASAKYSAGPKFVARSANAGAKNTTSVVATMPPMKAPIADVASA